ncbi:hypothetical protein CEXT_396341 [Caerostris extrusa]|uniref:Uncharacterized protein n=1 Tax=Caerostris extrusa TaxID=172846 RepID=A0AAV4RWY6_CAEEX|nr:hypothetical protein CEXT_396341 [Caerostris extrusa]
MSFKYSGPRVSRVQLQALACHYVHGGVQRVALTPRRLRDAPFTGCLRLSFSHLDSELEVGSPGIGLGVGLHRFFGVHALVVPKLIGQITSLLGGFFDRTALSLLLRSAHTKPLGCAKI